VPLLALAYLFAFAALGVQVSHAQPALERVGVGAAALGGVWAVRALLTIFAPAAWGAAADRLGRTRTTIVLAILGSAGALLVLGQARSWSGALLGFALYGLTGSAVAALLDGLTLTALGARGRRYGAIRAFGTLGFGLAALSTGVAVDEGWIEQVPSVVFSISAGCAVAAAVCVALTRPIPRPPMRRIAEVKALVRTPLLLLGGVGLFHWAGHAVYAAFLPAGAKAAGGGALVVGLSIAAAITVEVIVLARAEPILARLGVERALALSLVAGVARWTALAFIDEPALFIAAHALHGISFGFFYPASIAFVAERTPPHLRQSAQGAFFAAVFGVGGALGLILAGNAVERWGMTGAHLTMAALGSVAAAGFVLARRGMRAPLLLEEEEAGA
jgi:PPP family 3-phenylpropionic acid transporter